ncbi:phosphatase PAP2 family protein [Bifidobacterium cebidarum]|nr:phosphatase PAP2 family protein [Bifidobacterium cebidarum]
MNDAQHPVIRDPHAPANMVGSMDFATQRAVHDPLAALGSVPGEKRATEPAVDFDRGLSHDLDRGLARLDPLTVRPRISSRVLCAVFGLLMIAAAFGVWWLCVHTENGQSYDEIVWKQLPDNLPGWIAGIMNMVAQSWLVIAVSCALGAIGVATAVIRRRWWLVGQIAVLAALCWASTLLKGVLPRPFIIQTDSPVVNSAPSGHTVLATAAAVVLLIAVPRAARALAAVVGGTWAVLVGVSVMVGQWHRTSDVLMSILLVVGLTLIMLAFTRTSGMDDPGRRVSSVSVQIVGSVLITGGLLLMLYSAYVIWQVLPGLNIIASWAVQGSIVSSVVGIIGVTALAFGLLLALRHITAAPLSRLGLIGAPPAPPAQGAAPRGAR